ERMMGWCRGVGQDRLRYVSSSPGAPHRAPPHDPMQRTPRIMSATAPRETPQHSLPSYLHADHLGPWANYLAQVDRVQPYLGHLARWVETLKRPKRILVVDVPIELDDGTV